MPTYVYKFVDTGETIEVQQAFSDATLTEATHPTTGQMMPVRKVFTPVGVTFKGGGFYKTDSRGGSSKSSGSSASESGPPSSASSTGESSTKADTSKSATSKAATSESPASSSSNGSASSASTTSAASSPS